MFEAYKVAVRLTLLENVTAGLLSMSSAFTKTHGDATLLQARLDKLKMPTLVGGVLTGAGVLGLHAMLKQPLDEAEKYQNILGKLAAQGVGDTQLTQADKFAKSQRIIGASMSDTLKMVSEANSVLRNMEEAEAVAPMLLRMKFGIESVMNSEGHGSGHGAQAERMFMDALKTTELRGAIVDPKTGHFSEERFANALDFMTKAYTASGGLVKPSEYLNMIKTGGIAAKSLNDNAFYFGLMHMAQEQGGSRTGTGLMSAFQNMYMGRTTQQVGEEMQKMGLLSSSQIHYGRTGHVTKIDPGALKEADLFRTDQFAYMQQFMLPMLRAKGVKDGEDMKMEIAKLFSNRVGGSQWVTMYMERANIQKHMDAAQNAFGIEKMYEQGQKQYGGQKEMLGKNWDNLMLTLGEKVLPTAIKALEWLNPLLSKTVTFLQEHGTLTKYLIGAFAGLSILAVVAGGVILLGVAIGALQISLAGGALSVGLGAMATGIRLFAGAAMFGLRGLATGILFFGRALLMNPIGLIVTGIAAAAFLIWKNWSAIKPKLIALWDGIKTGFHTFVHFYLNGWQTLFNFLIGGINTLLPKAMALSKLTFADDYARKNLPPPVGSVANNPAAPKLVSAANNPASPKLVLVPPPVGSVAKDGNSQPNGGKIDSVRSAQQAVHVTVNNTVDEHGIASIVTRYQSKWADRPQHGSSGHDGRMSMVSPTLAGAGG